jgi:hypothetical protein
MTQDELKALIEDLRMNHEHCPKEVILQAADELERMQQGIETGKGQIGGEEMKKDIKVWAIKLRGRSFYQDSYNIPFLYPTKSAAMLETEKIADWKNRNPHNTSPRTEIIRVRARIEEIK